MSDEDGSPPPIGNLPDYAPPCSAAELLERYGRDEHTLPFAQLRSTVLSHVNLADADLTGAVLAETDLGHAILVGSVLLDADLSGSNLSFADLRGADLRGANLDNAELQGANLDGARLDSASLFHAVFGSTRLGCIDLSCTDLSWVRCVGPSVVDLDTLRLTARGLCERSADPGATALFLRRCGAPEPVVDLLCSWVTDGTTFPACYIAHSRKDTPFALRLYEALQERNVRCWPVAREHLAAEEQQLRLDRGPGRWERVVLCCSKDSLDSWWLEGDVDLAIRKDDWLAREYPDGTRPCLVAVDLDGAVNARDDTVARRVSERLVTDFQGWENDDVVFERAFVELIETLMRS